MSVDPALQGPPKPSAVDQITNASITPPRSAILLGRVDGFNQHQRACKTDDRGVAGVGLFAAHGDAFEPLELADRLFDARPQFIEALGKEAASLLGIFTTRDYRCDATCKRGDAIGGAVISLIGHRDARANVRADVERCLELGAVAGFTTGQLEIERYAEGSANG